MRKLYLDKPLIDLSVYKPVEYLEATGTQYINTGLLSTASSKVDVMFSFSSMESGSANNCAVFGGRNNTTNYTFTFFKLATGNPQYFRFDFNGKITVGTATQMTWNTSSVYRFEYDGATAKSTNITTGQSESVARSPGSTFTTSPISLFAVATNTQAGQFMGGRIYHYWYTDGTNTIDLYPVVRRSDNVAGMLDLIGGAFFTNNGSGTFNVGSEVIGPTVKKLHFIKESRRVLPKGFTEVEYLQSSGTQYIDTGVKANGSFKAKYKIYIPSSFTNFVVGGARSSTQHLNFGQYEVSGNFLMAYLGNYWTAGTPTTANAYFETEVDYKSGSQTGKVNGTSMLSGSYTGTEELNMNIYLFKRNFYGTTDTLSPFSGRIYYFKIWKDDGLVRDYIPCLDASNVPCLYDLVTKTAFYNKGTGSFTVGRKIIPVEYLESTGTQWIDTGILSKQSLKIKAKFEGTNTTVSQFAYGVRKDTATITCATGLSDYNLGYVRWGTSAYSVSTPPGLVEIEQDASGVKINGTTYTYRETQTVTPQTGYTMTIFAGRNSTSGVTANMEGKFYYLKLYDENTLVRDYIPSIDENNNVFMFDRVSHSCFLNAGTGTFKHSPVQVEYIESSGTQYINLGLKGKNGYDFDYKFNSTRIDSTAYGIGGEWETNKSCYLGLIRNTNKFAYHYQNTQSPIEVQTLTANTDYRVQAHLYSGEQYYIINGTKSAVGTISGTFESTTDMNLFRVNSSSPIYSYIKMYYLKAWDNGVLVRDMIPALKDGAYGMWDKKNEVFYPNAGTGTFSAGSFVFKNSAPIRLLQDAVPNAYQRVNYIESTGTQYIDTGVIGVDGVLADVNVMKTTNSTNECFLGTWDSGSNRCWLAYAFSNKWYPGYDGSASDVVAVSQNAWTNIKSYIETSGSNKYFGYNINGTNYRLTNRYTAFSGTNSIMMFAMNTNTGANYKATGRIGTCKITKDGVLVRDFIPVLRKSDNKAGMYDLCTKQFFTNQGTGNDFNYG